MSLLTFLMPVCRAPLLSCADNYVVVLCLVSLFMFLMSLCRESLLSCVDNYVDIFVLCHRLSL